MLGHTGIVDFRRRNHPLVFIIDMEGEEGGRSKTYGFCHADAKASADEARTVSSLSWFHSYTVQTKKEFLNGCSCL